MEWTVPENKGTGILMKIKNNDVWEVPPWGGRGFEFFSRHMDLYYFTIYIIRVSQLSILSLQGTHKHQSIYNLLNLDDTFFYVTATCTTH